ncbi:tetraacyldisaccharide 4'-kinase [Kolteria novifilia]
MKQEEFRRLVRGESRGWLASATRGALWVLSLPYALGVSLRNLAFDRGWREVVRARLPVLSVGNVTVGGTGKTPMVEYFASQLREKGLRVCLLSRGYGVSDGPNDEALVLEENLPDVPHLQGRNRAQLATIADEELESQVLVLDDGFQHRRLGRDADVVLIDATDPFGGGRLLPAGLLREPFSSLGRADLVVLTRRDAIDEDQRRSIKRRLGRWTKAPWAEVSFDPTALVDAEGAERPIAALAGKRVATFCGLGNPEGFRRTVALLGGETIDHRDFPDHHPYSRDDIESLLAWVAEVRPELVLTTQKDLVKVRLTLLGSVPLAAVKIAARVDEGAEAIDHVLAQIAAKVPREE